MRVTVGADSLSYVDVGDSDTELLAKRQENFGETFARVLAGAVPASQRYPDGVRVSMATRNRDDRGRFSRKIRDQDSLKAFDFEATDDDPFLTVSEVADALETHFGIDVTDEAVRARLQQMLDSGDLDRRQFGPSVAYRAHVGPALADDVAARSDERRETPRDEFVEL